SFSVLGPGELAARAPAALFGTLLVLMTYGFGARAFGRRSGFLAALVLATSVAFMATTRMMLTDVVFAFFVCGACFAWWLALEGERRRSALVVLAFASSALAVLTKGPLGLLIPALAAGGFAAVSRLRLGAQGPALAWGLAACAAMAAPWSALMIARHGWDYARAFFVHENLDRLLHAEHPANNHVFYYPLVLVVGSVPWLPALLVGLKRGRRWLAAFGAAPFMASWLASSLAFFTVAQSKLPTYVLFLLVPLSFLIATALDSMLREGLASRGERWLAMGAAAFQALAPLAGFAFPGFEAVRVPAAATALVLALSLALLARRPSVAWVTTSALATVVLVVCATTWSAGGIESSTSVKGIARELKRPGRAGLPVLCAAMLVRGLHYYAGTPPVVLSDRAHPFFTAHPIPVVVGAAGLEAFVRDHGPALCLLRTGEWHPLGPEARGAEVEVIGS